MRLHLAIPLVSLAANDVTSLLQQAMLNSEDCGSARCQPQTTTPTTSTTTLFPIWFDGVNKTDSQRQFIADVPLEVAFRFKNPDEQGIVVNDTHVIFPFQKMIQAQFVRNMKPQHVIEYGVVNSRFFPNLPSMLPGAQPVVGSGEKMHTLFSTGAWRTDSYEFATKDRSEQSPEQRQAARAQHVTKTKLANLFAMASGVGVQLNAAAMDPVDMKVTADLAGRAPPAAFLSMSDKLHRDLIRNSDKITEKAASAQAGKTLPISAATNCIHFTDAGVTSPVALELNANGDSTGFALERKVMTQSYRGQTSFHPLMHFSFARGGSVIDWDADTNEVTLYHASSSFFEVVDPDGTHMEPNPVLRLSSLTGTTAPVPWEDRRQSVTAPSLQAYQLYRNFRSIPTDYEHLFDDSLCLEGSQEYTEAKKAFEGFNAMALMAGRDPSQNVSRQEGARLVNEASEMMAQHSDCLAGYLRSPVKGSHGYGVIQAMAIVHSFMEVPGLHASGIFLDKNWNKFTM